MRIITVMGGSGSYRAFAALLALWFGVFNVALESSRVCATHDGLAPASAMGILHTSAGASHCGEQGEVPAASHSDTTGHRCPAPSCTCQGDCHSTRAIGLSYAPVLLGLQEQSVTRVVAQSDAWLEPRRTDLQLPDGTGPPVKRTALFA